MDELRDARPENIAGVVIEPLIQGVNEMRPWPAGMLADLRAWCDETGVHLILDEVMTGFGRTGKMFACQQENVIPDFLCLAKGITGGYLPHGRHPHHREHLRRLPRSARKRLLLRPQLHRQSTRLRRRPRQPRCFRSRKKPSTNLPAKIDHLARRTRRAQSRPPASSTKSANADSSPASNSASPDGEKFPPGERFGEAICLAARAHGLLTRPILDTIVLMPPLCTTLAELDHAVSALDRALCC